jgi:hypothetical protein
MSLDFDLMIKVAGPIVGSLVTLFVKDLYERRPKLVYFFVHSGAVSVPVTDGELRFHIHSVIVANQGRDAAKNVRLGHHNLPHYEITPPIEHSVKELAGGAKEIVIPVLIPRKQITINYLYHPPLFYNGVNSYVESDSGAAKELNVLPTPQWPKWVQIGIWLLLAYGLAAVIYTMVQFSP